MDSGMFAKLMQKKQDGEQAPMDPDYKKAKMSMLEALKAEMSKSMAGDLRDGSMKKVEVAAPDNESLGKGLDVAKQALGHDDELAAEDALEAPEVEKAEDQMGDKDGLEGHDDMGLDLKNMDPEKMQKLMSMLQVMLAKGSDNG